MEHTDDRNAGNDDDGNATGRFEPGDASTPGPSEQIPMRTTTMNRPPERGSHTAETSFIEGRGNLTREFQIQEAHKTIKYYYPEYKENLDLTINSRGKIVAKGPKGGDIEIFKADGKTLLSDFINRIGKNLGLTRENFFHQLNKEIEYWEKYISDQQKISENTSKDSSERALAERNIKKAKEDIRKLYNKINDAKNQTLEQETRIPEAPTLQEFQQHETERQERQQQIQLQIEQEEVIAKDENRPAAERQQARERTDALNQEINEIENEREEEIERLSLTDKLREKVKEIFKKYGFTVTTVLLAVGTTIGVIVHYLSNGLKDVARGVGNGLQTLGKKKCSWNSLGKDGIVFYKQVNKEEKARYIRQGNYSLDDIESIFEKGFPEKNMFSVTKALQVVH
ncbi:hypothetical protein ACROYT_G021168 [Oculina patagonica]